jgi:hypothetical protein
MGTSGPTSVSGSHCGSSEGASTVTECSEACGSAAGRSGASGLVADNTGSSGSSLCTCGPDASDLGEGGIGPGDDVAPGSSVDAANPGEGAEGKTEAVETVRTLVRM